MSYKKFLDDLYCKELGKQAIKGLSQDIFDYAALIEEKSVKALYEISLLIKNKELEDSVVLELIIQVLEKYDIDAGTRHDFS